MHLPRHAELWFPGYLRDRIARTFKSDRTQRVWVAVMDHYEPFWNKPSIEQATRRVRAWSDNWPEIASRAPRDSAGNAPTHTFFYPQEEYRAEFIEQLAGMTRAGIADVEIHIHHDREGRDEFIRRMSEYRDCLVRDHRLLRKEEGKVRFGFIHGNWALDNSLPDGHFCGLNDEITILRDLGCYADFTMPSGNSASQSTIVNSIYWCKDDPEKPKSYDRGIPAESTKWNNGDLLIVDGPLGLRWKDRLIPRLETGEVAAYDLPTPYRVKRWFDLAPVLGADRFIKLYTHGATESNAGALLHGGLRDLYQQIAAEANSREVALYFVSAWQMYVAIRAACTGMNPAESISRSINAEAPRGIGIQS